MSTESTSHQRNWFEAGSFLLSYRTMATVTSSGGRCRSFDCQAAGDPHFCACNRILGKRRSGVTANQERAWRAEPRVCSTNTTDSLTVWFTRILTEWTQRDTSAHFGRQKMARSMRFDWLQFPALSVDFQCFIVYTANLNKLFQGQCYQRLYL